MKSALSGNHGPIEAEKPNHGKRIFKRDATEMPEVANEVVQAAVTATNANVQEKNASLGTTEPVTVQSSVVKPAENNNRVSVANQVEQPPMAAMTTTTTAMNQQRLAARSSMPLNPTNQQPSSSSMMVGHSQNRVHTFSAPSVQLLQQQQPMMDTATGYAIGETERVIPNFKQRRNSIGAIPQFSRIDAEYHDRIGRQYPFAPDRTDGTLEMFVDLHEHPELQPLKIESHEELNPRNYKNLPPAFTNFIRPAGKPTIHTITTSDCFNYFD